MCVCVCVRVCVHIQFLPHRELSLSVTTSNLSSLFIARIIHNTEDSFSLTSRHVTLPDEIPVSTYFCAEQKLRRLRSAIFCVVT